MRDSELIPTGETNAVCITNTGTTTPAIKLCATVDLTGKTVYYQPPNVTAATLPSSPGIVIVTDAASSASCLIGGGSTKLPCWWNGASWVPLGTGGGGGGTGDVTDVNGTTNEICVTNPTGPAPTVALCSTVSIAAKILQLGRWDLIGDITPTALSGATADWNPSGLASASTIRVACTGAQNISGLQGGSDGRILTLYNVGTAPCTLQNQNSGSAAANRFTFGADITLQPNQGIVLQYDATSSGWRSLSTVTLPSDSHYGADAGSSDAYAANLSPAISAYKTGSHYFFKANTANTGAASVAFNGLSAIPIKKPVGGVTTDLDNNDIQANQIVEVVYDGTNMQMISMLGNAATGISGGTVNAVAKYNSASTLTPSGISEDASNTLVAKAPIFGNCATDCLTEDRSAITGAKTHSYPNHTGTIGVFPNARKALQVELFDAASDVTTGNGKAYLRVPSGLNGTNLVSVETNVVTAGTTGLTSVQLTRCVTAASGNLCSGTTVSMLSTVASIDSGENSSSTAATPAVINSSNDDVASGQIIRFDVTAVSSTAPKGLIVLLEFELP